ncbi:uncharacterized protein LOC129267062 isoform X3 [Lytechinus pictus]|uniref:uncharacterized protein LOC129267062 isoform X3 n=1 Tax=Lytechinus pictus TaxID=7653 RepID=UPI0030B9B7E8
MRLHEFSFLSDFIDVFTEMKYYNKVISVIIILSHYTCKYGTISASCAKPDVIPNTVTPWVNQTLDTGSYIRWECSAGYVMQGNTNTVLWVCLEDGTWLGHDPSCTVIECPSPPIAAYSELETPLTNSPVVNETITYACSSNDYTLMDNTGNRCLMDGTWEKQPPVCKINCQTGNYIRRYSDLVCYRQRDYGNEREWESSFNLCHNNRNFLATVKDAETQSFLVKFVGQSIGEDTWIGAKEGLDWKWRHSDEYIKRFFWKDPFPDASEGNFIEMSFEDGSFSWNPQSSGEKNGVICQYGQSCQHAGLNQSDTVLDYMGICFQFMNVSNNWDDGVKTCNRSGGFLAEILDNSTNTLLVERALDLRKNIGNTAWWIGGYDADDSERSWYWSDKTRVIYNAWYSGRPDKNNHDCVEMKENHDYKWDDSSCSKMRKTLCQIGLPACGDPGQPLHGNRLPDDRTTYLDGATLHFSCNEGFILSGEEILTCMTNGSWNHSRPFCEAVKCEGMPLNVTRASKSMVQSAYYRDTTVYTCDDGYIPDNVPISFCQHTGNWSIPNFTCSALSPCYSNPCLNGGTCSVNGSSLICTCPEGYIGTTCDEEFDPCDSNPCINGGSCFESGSSFSCTCSSDYTGPTCDEEIPEGNPAPLGAIAAGSSVAILFIIVFIIFTVVFFRRHRTPKRIIKDDENEMENYAAVANSYEESKPVNGTPHEPYYLTLVPESDHNGGSVDHVATQPHLGNGGVHKDPNYFVKGLNDWAETDAKEGFVDNVLYEASDEPTVKPSSLSSNCHKTSNSQGILSSNHVIDEHHGSRDNKSDATNVDEDDYMIENELYKAQPPTTPRSLNLESVGDQGTDDVYENPDENIYTDCKDDDILIENELYGVPSPTTPRAHNPDAVVDNVNDAVYEDPDKTNSIVENGAATPSATRAAYENHTVVDEVNDGIYEELNDDADAPPTSRVAYINEAVDDDVYEAVGDAGEMVDNELYIPAT